MGTKTHNNYEDIINFVRASSTNGKGAMALRPVSYGTELVVNGTFNSDLSDWDAVSGAANTWQSGAIRVTASAGDSIAAAGQDISSRLETGKVYKFSGDVVAISSNDISPNIRLGISSTSASALHDVIVILSETESAQVGSFSGVFVHSGGTAVIGLAVLNGSSAQSEYVEFDNISVKEVTFDQPDGTLTLFPHPENVPRVEWDSAGNRLGMLVEEQRTNLIPYSEDFSNAAAWFPQNLSSVTAVSNSLTGNNDAYELVENSTASAQHRIYDTLAISNATGYSSSVYAKRGTGSRDVAIISVPAGMRVYFNLEDGTVGQETNGTGQIVDVGDGWYKCTATGTSTGTSTSHYLAICDGTTTGSETYDGDGTSSVILFGAQLEEGSFPTSYIKTTGSTATRSADVASIPVADFGFNQSAGTVLVELQHFDTRTGSKIATGIGFGDGTTNNRMWYYQNKGQWIGASGGVSQFSMTGSEPSENTPTKFAGVFKADDFTAYIDGTSIGTDSSGSVPVVPTLFIGYSGTSNSELNGHIKSIKYYPRRLTNAQLQDLTS